MTDVKEAGRDCLACTHDTVGYCVETTPGIKASLLLRAQCCQPSQFENSRNADVGTYRTEIAPPNRI